MNSQCVMIKSWAKLVEEHSNGGLGYVIEKCPIFKTLQIRRIDSCDYVSKHVIDELSKPSNVLSSIGYYLYREYRDGARGLIVRRRADDSSLYRVPFGVESLFLPISELNPRLYKKIVLMEF